MAHDYPSQASRRNIRTAEGAIPVGFGSVTAEGPSAKYEGMSNPSPPGVYECAFDLPADKYTPASYTAGSLKGDKGGPTLS